MDFIDLCPTKPRPKGLNQVVKHISRQSRMQQFDGKLRSLAVAAKTALAIDSLLDSSVLVALRIRPLLGHEKNLVKSSAGRGHGRSNGNSNSRGSRSRGTNSNSPFHTNDEEDITNICLRDGTEPGQVIVTSQETGKDITFKLDAVLNDSVPQDQMYSMTAKRILVKVLKGYNGTVFAYGQTGSGKTFTMLGPDGGTAAMSTDLMGLIPRAVKEIFEVKERNPGTVYKFSCSYTEIYKEEIRDLLRKKKEKKVKIVVRRDKKGDVFLDGASIETVDKYEDVMRLIAKGNTKRQTGGHALNAHSSRSHAVFTIYIQQCTMKSGRGVKLCSKFHLIDLAGSERAKRTGASGDRLKEGSAINSSLSALGNVIKALTDGVKTRSGSKSRAKGKKKLGHVPFRDSMLTRVLQDSLGGNSFTLMVCNVSPHASHDSETISSLRFAERVKLVQNSVKINQEELSVGQTKSLQKVNDQLRSQLEEMQRSQQVKLAESLANNDQVHQEELQRVEIESNELKLKIAKAEKERLALAGLVKASATHDITRICKIANDSVKSIMDASASRIYFIDEDDGQLWCNKEDENEGEEEEEEVEVEEERGVEGNNRRRRSSSAKGARRIDLPNESIAGRVGKTGQTIQLSSNVTSSQYYNGMVDVVEKVQNDNGEDDNMFSCPSTPPRTTSILSMPILHGDKIVGVISAFNKLNNQPWNASDVEALQVLCNHLAAEVQREVHGGGDGVGDADPVATIINTFHDQLLDLTTSSSMNQVANKTDSLLKQMLLHDTLNHHVVEMTLFLVVNHGKSIFPISLDDKWELYDPISKNRYDRRALGLLGECIRSSEMIDATNLADEDEYNSEVDKCIAAHLSSTSCIVLPLYRTVEKLRRASQINGGVLASSGLKRPGSLSNLGSIEESDNEDLLDGVCGVLRLFRNPNKEENLNILKVAQATIAYIQNAIINCYEEAERTQAAKKLAESVKAAHNKRRASTFRHATQMSLQKKTVEKKMGALQMEHKSKVEEIKQQMATTFSSREEQLKDQLRQAHEQMDVMFEENEDTMQTLKNDMAVAMERNGKIQQELRMELQTVQHKHDSLDKECKHLKLNSSELMETKTNLETELMNFKNRLSAGSTRQSESSKQITALQNEMDEMLEAHVQELKTLKKNHQEVLRVNLDEQKSEMEQEHQHELERKDRSVQNQYAQQRQDNVEEIESQQHQHDQTINEMKRKLKMLTNKYNEKTSNHEELKEMHQEEISKHRRKHATLMDKKKMDHDEELERIKIELSSQHDEHVQHALKEKESTLKTMSRNLKDTHALEMESLQKKHRLLHEKLNEENNLLRQELTLVEEREEQSTEELSSITDTLGNEKSKRIVSQFRRAADHARGARISEELKSKTIKVEELLHENKMLKEGERDLTRTHEQEKNKWTEHRNQMTTKHNHAQKAHSEILLRMKKDTLSRCNEYEQRAVEMRNNHQIEQRRTESESSSMIEQHQDEVAVLNNKIQGMSEMLTVLKDQLDHAHTRHGQDTSALVSDMNDANEKKHIELKKLRSEYVAFKNMYYSNIHSFVGMMEMQEGSLTLHTLLNRWKQEIKVKSKSTVLRLSKLLDSMLYIDQYSGVGGSRGGGGGGVGVVSPLKHQMNYKEEEINQLNRITMNTRKEDARIKSEQAQRKRMAHNATMIQQYKELLVRHDKECQQLIVLHDQHNHLTIKYNQIKRFLSRVAMTSSGGGGGGNSSRDVEQLRLSTELHGIQRELSSSLVGIDMTEKQIAIIEEQLNKLQFEVTMKGAGHSSGSGAHEHSNVNNVVHDTFQKCTSEIEQLQTALNHQQTNIDEFEMKISSTTSKHRQQFSVLYSQLDEAVFDKEAALRNEDSTKSQLLELEERSLWLEGLLENNKEVRVMEHDNDALQNELAVVQTEKKHLSDSMVALRENLAEANEQIALLSRMLRLPSLRQSVALQKAYGSAAGGSTGGSTDSVYQKIRAHESNVMKRDPFSSTLTSAYDEKLYNSTVSVDSSLGSSSNGRSVNDGNNEKEIDLQQQYQHYQRQQQQEQRSEEYINTPTGRAFFTPAAHTSHRPGPPVAATVPHEPVPLSPSHLSSLSTSMDRMDRTNNQQQLEPPPFTFPSPSISTTTPVAGGLSFSSVSSTRRSKKSKTSKEHKGEARLAPAVDVFTSTLHTVFTYFANRRSHVMGKGGYRRFYLECPGLQNNLNDGQLEVVFSRSANKKGQLDFARWVDALLWISVIKYSSTSDIGVTFWRLISEHVLLFSFVPIQVQQGALAASSSKLAAKVLFQATGQHHF